MIEETRLLTARNELARARAELADTKAEVSTWRETIAGLEARALELSKSLTAVEAQKQSILADCAALPAALAAAINTVLENHSKA